MSKFSLHWFVQLLFRKDKCVNMRIAYHFRRLIALTLFIALIYFIIQILKSDWRYNDINSSNLEKLIHMSQLIKESSQQAIYVYDGNSVCKFPELNVTNPEMMKFIHDTPPLDCSPDDWVKVEGSKLFIVDKIKNHYGPVTCAVNEIIRVDDDNNELSNTVEVDDYYVLQNSDFVQVKCETQTGKQWQSVLAGVKEDLHANQANWNKVPENSLKLNVLMFGFDSLSRNTFIRKLPKSYRYMKQNLNSQILEGYNIVGDGTPQALIPLLTGKIELELPDTRKRMGIKANYVDVYPMIWKRYKEAGYITGFMEDVPHIGTFNYRLKGFKNQPTDHYMRTYYLSAVKYYRYSKKFCIGEIPRHMVMMNYIKTIFNTYHTQPKFIFGFHGELSHDSINDIGVADDDLYNWMKDLHDFGHLNNTIFILMSDHGNRFAEMRNTLQGKQEERLPFFSFTFPKWFKQVHPRAYANFLYNTKLLTTPFDVHKTLESIFDFKPPKEGDRSQRAISLFDKIPSDRTCADAFIEPHWCACLTWEEIKNNDPQALGAATYFVEFLNNYTKDFRNICEELFLNEILWVAKLLPTKGLLHFNQAGDQDGFVGDFSANTKVTLEQYQLKVSTEPGGALFEASIVYDVKSNVYQTKISDISRINKYEAQARCVENKYYHLRKYCYCKD